jgi:hypothetical protein
MQPNKIRKYYHYNSDNTKIICNTCDQSYSYKTSVTVLKRHLARFHDKDYEEFLNQEQKKLVKQTQDKQQNSNVQQKKLTDFIQKDKNIINFNYDNEQNFYFIANNKLYTYNTKKIKIIYE